MLLHLHSARVDTGTVPVTVDVYEDTTPEDASAPIGEAAVAAAEGTPGEIEIDRPVRLQWGDPQTVFARHVYPSWCELSVYATDTLADVLASSDPARYLWRVAWADHVWYGYMANGEAIRTIAPAVYPGRVTTVRLWDRLSGLADARGFALASYQDILAWLRRTALSTTRHLPLLWAPGIIGEGQDGYPNVNPARERFAGEIAADPTPGDYGTALEQIDRYCESRGLLLFQQTRMDATPGHTGPAWWMVPRSRMAGEGEVNGGASDAQRIDRVSRTSVQVPALPVLTLTAEDFASDRRGVEEVPPVRTIRIDVDGDLTPPIFPEDTGESQDGTGSGTLDEGEVRQRSLGTVAGDGVRLRLLFEHFGMSDELNPGIIVRAGYLEVEAVQATGSLYLNPTTGAWENQSAATRIKAPNTGAAWRPVEATSVGLPGVAEMVLRAVGGRESGPPEDVLHETRGLSVLLIDSGDATVLWTAYHDTGVSDGEIVTLGRVPRVERQDGSLNWAEPPRWHRYPDLSPIGSLAEHAVALRATQQHRALAAPRARALVLLSAGQGISIPAANVGRTGQPVGFAVGGGVALGLDTADTHAALTEVIV